MNGYRTRRSHSAKSGEGCHWLGREPTERSIGTRKDRVADVERRPSPAAPRTNDDGEQLNGTERVGTEVLQPLARPFGPGELPDT